MKIPFFSEDALERVFPPVKLGCKYPFIMIDAVPVGFQPNSIVYSLAAVLFSLNPAEQVAQERCYPDNSLHYRFDMAEQVSQGGYRDEVLAKLVDNNIKVAAIRDSYTLPLSSLKEGMDSLYAFINRFRRIDESIGIITASYHNGIPILDNLLDRFMPRNDSENAICLLSLDDAITNLLQDRHFPEHILKDEWFTPTALGNCLNNIRRLQLAYMIQEKTICSE